MATEGEIVKPAVSRRKWILATLGAVALLALGFFSWRAWSARAAVDGFIPDQPDLTGWAAELPDRLARAEADARGYLRPVAGLRDLARLYHANGFYDDAALCYAGLQRAEPGEARWAHLRAVISSNLGQLEEAVPHFRRAAELDPDYVPAQIRLGDALLKGNAIAEAAQIYEAVLRRQRDEPYALLGLARVAIARDRWDEARQHLLRAIAANPDFVGALSLMATVHEHAGEGVEAAAVRVRVNKREFLDITDPWQDELMDDCYDSYRLSVAAAVAIFRGAGAQAEAWLQRAIQYSPRPAPFYRQLANYYVGRQDYAAAKHHFERATVIAPTDSDAWALLVNLLKDGGDRAGAYRTVLAGLQHCPESRALHFAYGRMLSQDGRYPQAMAELQEAKRIQPGEANAYVELALIHFRLQEADAGLAELRAALGAQPDHPIALVVLARYAVADGDESTAKEMIRRARLQTKVPADELRQTIAEFTQKFGRMP